MVTAYLFDVGNVILAFDFTKAARRIEAFSRCSAAEILTRVSSLTDTLELGHITAEEFYARTTELIGYHGDHSFLVESFEKIFELNQPIVEFIEARHAEGTPLHLLSNTNAIHVPFFEKTYPVFRCFSGRVYSHEVGSMKPDPTIYEAVVNTISLEPSSTIYVDDLPANCAAGREAGFLTIQYDRENHDAFLREVAKIDASKEK